MPVAPASMFLMNRSWPGTSTMPRRMSPRSRLAKPMSMVMPRCFLLGQPVAVDAGERLDERGLAVVDVARRCRGSGRVAWIVSFRERGQTLNGIVPRQAVGVAPGRGGE